MTGIYMIKNIQNNKVYIGKSVNIMYRWQEHIKQSEEATEFEDKFHFDLGQTPEDFSFNILKTCPESELSEWEDFYIKKYNSIENGYNKISAATTFIDDKPFARSERDIIRKLNSVVGKPLFVNDKKKLAAFFGYKNSRGISLGWTTLKRKLIENGFDIIETKRKVDGKMKNCSIISVKYEY